MEHDSVLSSALRDFKRSVEITRDVRFQANLRLATRQKLSAYMVSLLSLFVIAISLLPNILVLHSKQSQILLACSIVLSVFVIFTSLIEGSQNFYYQGELLHQCARKVATVYHDLKNIDVSADPISAEAKFVQLQVEYRKALDECPINHSNVDYAREKGRKRYLFENEYNCFWPTGKQLFYRVYGLVGPHSWMFLHLCVMIAVFTIVYRYVL